MTYSPNEQQLRELVERGIPEVPAAFATPPTTELRRRVARRRRWVAIWGTAGAVLAALTVGLAVRPVAAPAPQPSPTGAPVVLSTVGWQVAVVDRDDRSVRLLVSPPPWLCVDYGELTVLVDEDDPARVSLTTAGEGATSEVCGGVAEARARLARPLGDRTVDDGAAPGRARLVVRSADLPELPGWTEIPATYSHLEPDWFVLGYTRPSGPDLRIEASLDPSPRAATPAGTLRLGGRTGTLYPTDDGHEIVWEARGVTYAMAPRQPLELAAFEQLIRDMRWP